MLKQRRLRKILTKTGRSLIIAMDHGTHSGPAAGIDQPQRTIEELTAGGADAVLANPGLAMRFADSLAGIGLIMRLDLPPTLCGSGHESRIAFSVDHALRIGADAVIVNGGPGVGVEERSLPLIAKVVEQCAPVGMPVVGEMIPGGFDADVSFKTLENMVLSARIASEIGVDIIKIRHLPGFKQVTAGCFTPMVVLGGSKSHDPKDFLASVKEAMDDGAAGAAVGRNVWGAKNVYGMTRALSAIIHDDASLEEALLMLDAVC